MRGGWLASPDDAGSSRQFCNVRRSVDELVREFLRETGILVFVFYGLAALLSAEPRARPLAATLEVLRGRSGEKEVEMSGFYLQLRLVALGGLLVFLFGLYSIHREKKRS
jgi:hypothetical protein